MQCKYTIHDRLSDIINHNPLILMAMSRFGISLGFGEKTVGEICQEQGVQAKTFLAVANYISFGVADTTDVSLPSLMGYLEKAHAYFLDFCLPAIRRRLIEAVDCTGRDEIPLLILKFYDQYVEEVRRHMEYETREVFTYVKSLTAGAVSADFSIDVFASHHHSIHDKMGELKDIIIRYLPQKDNNLLNATLFDIMSCEQDLVSHCKVEDELFVPVVERLEEEMRASVEYSSENANVDSERHDEPTEQVSTRERDIISCVARGLSNKEIADRLNISVNTVTTHRRNLVQKLGIHSPAGLTIYAVINGIVDIRDLADAL